MAKENLNLLGFVFPDDLDNLMGQLKVANDDSENENDSEVQFQNKDASFQSAIDENDDKKDTFETAETAENAIEMSSDNDLLAFTPKNVPAASTSIIKLVQESNETMTNTPNDVERIQTQEPTVPLKNAIADELASERNPEVDIIKKHLFDSPMASPTVLSKIEPLKGTPKNTPTSLSKLKIGISGQGDGTPIDVPRIQVGDQPPTPPNKNEDSAENNMKIPSDEVQTIKKHLFDSPALVKKDSDAMENEKDSNKTEDMLDNTFNDLKTTTSNHSITNTILDNEDIVNENVEIAEVETNFKNVPFETEIEKSNENEVCDEDVEKLSNIQISECNPQDAIPTEEEVKNEVIENLLEQNCKGTSEIVPNTDQNEVKIDADENVEKIDPLEPQISSVKREIGDESKVTDESSNIVDLMPENVKSSANIEICESNAKDADEQIEVNKEATEVAHDVELSKDVHVAAVEHAVVTPLLLDNSNTECTSVLQNNIKDNTITADEIQTSLEHKNVEATAESKSEIMEQSEKDPSEVEEPLPKRGGYNLDFLDNLDDPNFNPFETKAKVSNLEDEPIGGKSSSEAIEDKLNDPNFNPFETKSKVANEGSESVTSKPTAKVKPQSKVKESKKVENDTKIDDSKNSEKVANEKKEGEDDKPKKKPLPPKPWLKKKKKPVNADDESTTNEDIVIMGKDLVK